MMFCLSKTPKMSIWGYGGPEHQHSTVSKLCIPADAQHTCELRASDAARRGRRPSRAAQGSTQHRWCGDRRLSAARGPWRASVPAIALPRHMPRPRRTAPGAAAAGRACARDWRWAIGCGRSGSILRERSGNRGECGSGIKERFDQVARRQDSCPRRACGGALPPGQGPGVVVAKGEREVLKLRQ